MMPATTRGQYLQHAKRTLAAAGISTAALDARILCCHAWQSDQVGLITQDHKPLTAEEIEQADALIAARCRRKPIAYIIGYREFWRQTFVVNPSVLIPRAETERLVEIAISLRAQGVLPTDGFTFLDLGTGSGCIATALLNEWRDCNAIAVDISPAAAAIARLNLRNHGCARRAHVICAHWTSAISKNYPLLLSNPPYIAQPEWKTIPPDVADFEPPLALRGGSEGYTAYRSLLSLAPAALRQGGAMLLEVGHTQCDTVLKLAADSGLIPLHLPAAGVLEGSARDVAGHRRVVALRRP